MPCAANQEIVSGALDDAGRHAIQNRDDGNHYRTCRVSDSGIDFVNTPHGHAGLRGQTGNRTVRIRYVKGVVEGIEGARSESRGSKLAGLISRGDSVVGNECAGVVVNDGGVVARY